MKKILILGAGGFIGRNLVDYLSAERQIIAFSNVEISFEVNSNVEILLGDFRVFDFTNILEEVDTVIHLISTCVPKEGTEKICNEIEDNVVATVRFLEFIKNKSVRFIFFSSGGSIYGEMPSGKALCSESDSLIPISSYSMTKMVIENYIDFYRRQYDLDAIIMRVANPYGRGFDVNKHHGVIPTILYNVANNKVTTIWGDGQIVRDYIYIEDLTYLTKLAIDYTGNQSLFNIGTGVGHSIIEVIKVIEEVIGKKVSIEFTHSRNVDVHLNVLDITRMKTELKCTDPIDIENGIIKLWNEFNSN